MTADPVAWGAIITGIFALIAGAYAARSARRNKQQEYQHDDRTPSPPTTQQVWDRQNQIEKDLGAKLQAALTILWQLSEDWPEGVPTPTLDEEALKVLSDVIPPRLKPKRRRPTTGSVGIPTTP